MQQSAQINPDEFKDDRVRSDEKTLAIISHALSFVEGGIVGPLIVYFLKRNDSPFIAFHALQSVYFGLLFLAGTLLFLCTCVGPAVVAVIYAVFEIIACVKASDGVWYKLPIVGEWALRSHPIPPFVQPPAPQ